MRLVLRTGILLVIVWLSTSLFTSCRKIDAPEQNFEIIFGRWKWLYSTGGWAGGCLSPSSEGYQLEIEFKQNGIYKEFKDGRMVKRLNFRFEKRPSIYSADEKYVVVYYLPVIPHKFQTPAYQSFYFYGTDTLVLNDECYDCYSHVFVRIE